MRRVEGRRPTASEASATGGAGGAGVARGPAGGAGSASGAGATAGAEVRVAPAGAFDFDWAVRFLSARAVPGLERAGGGEYVRSVRVHGDPLVLRIRWDAGRRVLAARSAPPLAPAALERIVVRLFDLDADLDAFLALAERDPVLRRTAALRPGIRLPQILDPFEGLVRAILGQQVSVAAAATITGRLVARAGEPAPALDGERLLAFPRPEAIAAAGEGELLALGLTRAKARAIAGAARAIAEGRLRLDELRAAGGDAAADALLALPGVGPWTADYVRMRALGDRDAFPAADLGVLKALRAAHPDGGRLGAADAAALAERWRPWRAYATLHLWESLQEEIP